MNLYDKLASLLTQLDRASERNPGNFPELFASLGIPLPADEAGRVAMQRALRLVLVRSGRPIPTTAAKPVALTPDERTQQMLLAGSWLDGFTAGYLLAQEQREVGRG